MQFGYATTSALMFTIQQNKIQSQSFHPVVIYIHMVTEHMSPKTTPHTPLFKRHRKAVCIHTQIQNTDIACKSKYFKNKGMKMNPSLHGPLLTANQ